MYSYSLATSNVAQPVLLVCYVRLPYWLEHDQYPEVALGRVKLCYIGLPNWSENDQSPNLTGLILVLT